ncbi:hypothetical protein GUJ93_ZPchr0011g28202 [Zizania palustris]|uniref:Uncharacterized protein n=1 Tax=Zizania palustris TaxID=103762 RepID=A0A8J5WIP1_ZIZPA|nr:hypothetical protein GUJ93_ZPchr0011g28202 [Zizania palustris]
MHVRNICNVESWTEKNRTEYLAASPHCSRPPRRPPLRPPPSPAPVAAASLAGPRCGRRPSRPPLRPPPSSAPAAAVAQASRHCCHPPHRPLTDCEMDDISFEDEDDDEIRTVTGADLCIIWLFGAEFAELLNADPTV